MNDIKDVSLVNAAPPNLAEDNECASLLAAAEKQFQKTASKLDRLALLKNIDKQPSGIVDALAYSYHLDFYEASMPIEMRRDLVKNHNEWHRMKGTPEAINRVLRILLGDGYIVEWFKREGMEPYTFEVHTSNASAVTEKYDQIVKAVNAM